MADDKTFRFNWHEQDRNSFLEWMLIAIIAETADWKALQAAMPEKWTENVEIQVLVNGFEIDATHFWDRLPKVLDDSAQEEARRILNELFDMESMQDSVSAANDALRDAQKEAVTKFCEAVGIEPQLHYWEDEYR